MFDKYLINQDLMTSGVYRGYVIKRDDSRAYIPGISDKNILDDNGDISNEDYQKIKKSLPLVLYNSSEIEKLVDDKPTPCIIAFEDGNMKRPIVMAFFGKGVKSVPGSGGGGASSADGSNGSSDGSFSTASGNGVINIQGPVNDSRTTKYSDISQIPQVITREWSISGCLSKINNYASQSASSNSIAPVAKAINAAGGASSVYNSALGTNVVSIGNAVLCATTSKFGTDGDYLWAHFTDGTECLFVRFDEKSQTYQSYDTFPANEWGHWLDHSYSSISILEICGMGPDGLNKTCDYIVNLGINIKNDAAFAKKSMSEIKSFVQQKITVNNNGGSNGNSNGVINYSNWRYPLSFKTEPGSAGHFGDARSNGRIHAGIDLYTKGNGKNYNNAPVYACEAGVVVENISNFLYAGVGSIAIKHNDGSIIRY